MTNAQKVQADAQKKVDEYGNGATDAQKKALSDAQNNAKNAQKALDQANDNEAAAGNLQQC